MPSIHDDQPRLTNRGAAGLLSSSGKDLSAKAGKAKETEDKILAEAPKDRVAPSLKHLVVPIASLKPDPMNARKHPEKNLRAVMLSLALFGQRKVISVRKDGMIVMAGNGTLEAAKALGWTKVAAAVDDDLHPEDWAAYGLADNRSAEHARWDWETMAQLEKMISESDPERADALMVGWTLDELEVLREADWMPPEESDEELAAAHMVSIRVTEDEKAEIDKALELIHSREGCEALSPGEALKTICLEWITK